MAQKKPVKRLKRGGRGGRGGGGGSNKPGSTQASGDGSNKPGGGGSSGGFSSAGKNLGGGGGGGNVAAPIGGGGGGGIPAPNKGGGGISTPAGGLGGEALPPGVSPQVAAGALAQLTGGKVDLRGIAGVPRGPGAPLARDVLTKQGPADLPPMQGPQIDPNPYLNYGDYFYNEGAPIADLTAPILGSGQTPAMAPMAPTPTAVPAPTPVAPTPTAVPAPTPTLAPPAAMTPDMIAADTAATAGGIPPGSRAPMGGGLLALGLNALNPLMRGSGRGLFGGGERMTADQIFAREAEMSRGGEGGGMSGPIFPTPTAPEATPAPVAPVTPTFTPPVYTPPPPPTPTRGYQSYFDLMRARNQPGIIPGLAGGGMVQPSMTNAFTPGSYYAAYDPRRRGLGGM